MALTKVNTNFDGDISQVLYSVLAVGNELSAKNTMYVETSVPDKRSLPRLSSSDNPIGAYVVSPGAGDQTDTTLYEERDLVLANSMHYESFLPDDFILMFPEYRSRNDFTNLQLDPQFWAAILTLKQNKIGTQISKLFWAGDTASGVVATNRFDGIVKQATADADVIDVANIGVITKANVVTVLENIWAAIPEHLLERPEFNIHMSTADWRLLQAYNNDVKKGTVGVLSQVVEDLFLEKRIKHYSGMPKNVIIAAEGYASPMSNLVMGVWVDPTGENPIVDKLAANSKAWFIRIDYKLGASYRAGEEIVMYKGA